MYGIPVLPVAAITLALLPATGTLVPLSCLQPLHRRTSGAASDVVDVRVNVSVRIDRTICESSVLNVIRVFMPQIRSGGSTPMLSRLFPLPHW